MESVFVDFLSLWFLGWCGLRAAGLKSDGAQFQIWWTGIKSAIKLLNHHINEELLVIDWPKSASLKV